MADSIQKLQALLAKVVKKSEEYALSVNKAKSKRMVISKFNTERCDLKIGEEIIEQVDSFNYLKQPSNSRYGRSEKEIQRKIGTAKTTLRKWMPFSKIGSCH